ncbi:hypothetical protein KFK09_001502 [Dendrobium nobile]|uniref:Uncharacterized protein n=1 Tax=Dendrobium nobile TaxID=94219 RepID=A0A8T3C7L7_DENNO|nr:hypothetical protein KFK09_001502 [Dendrobium nobile]
MKSQLSNNTMRLKGFIRTIKKGLISFIVTRRKMMSNHQNQNAETFILQVNAIMIIKKLIIYTTRRKNFKGGSIIHVNNNFSISVTINSKFMENSNFVIVKWYYKIGGISL